MSDSHEKLCPECRARCQRDEVDIGVGIQHGPWSCPECGWSEEEDRTYLCVFLHNDEIDTDKP